MSSFSYRQISNRIILPTILILFACICTTAQSSVVTTNTRDADAIQRRIERARALAAAHQLEAASSELEALRASVSDAALRNITSLMLMGIYLEEANYVRAQAILEETFQARSLQKDDSIRTYFALAGQAINGVRSHLARYRSFGINTSDVDLPPEALSDLNRLRSLLERMVAQAREIIKGDARAYDALALQEDVLGIRLSLARDDDDRDKWQTEYVAAREKQASAQIQIASIGRIPSGAAAPKVTRAVPVEKPPVMFEKDGGTNSQQTSSTTAAIPQPSPPSDQPAAAPTSDKESEPKAISIGSLNGRERKRVTPAYPQGAQAAGASGVVRVYVIVDEKGKVSVTRSEGPMLLRQPAEDAARGWSFPPTVVADKPVRVSGFIEFNFTPSPSQ